MKQITLYGEDRNLAVACKASRVLVVDVDPRHGGHHALESLLKLNYIPDLNTIEALTGNYFIDGQFIRGRHLYFEVPEDATFVTKLSAFPGIDFKHNGYVVVPPSIHVSGVPYEWAMGHSPAEINIQPIPEALQDLLRTRENPTRPVQGSISPDDLEALNSQSFGPTARTALSDLVEQLRRAPEGQADMFTSARHGEVGLNLVTRVQVTLGLDKTEAEAIEEVKEIYSSNVGPLALRSLSAGGFSEPLNPPEADYRQAHAWFHLSMHVEAGNIPAEGFPVAFRTALEYKLIKSFGFRAATPMIADFENVTPVAVDRRLFMAREANYLSKASGAASKRGL